MKLKLVYIGETEYQRDFNIQMLDISDIEVTPTELKFIDNTRQIYINDKLYRVDGCSIIDIISKLYTLKIVSQEEYDSDNDLLKVFDEESPPTFDLDF